MNDNAAHRADTRRSNPENADMEKNRQPFPPAFRANPAFPSIRYPPQKNVKRHDVSIPGLWAAESMTSRRIRSRGFPGPVRRIRVSAASRFRHGRRVREWIMKQAESGALKRASDSAFCKRGPAVLQRELPFKGSVDHIIGRLVFRLDIDLELRHPRALV